MSIGSTLVFLEVTGVTRAPELARVGIVIE
jgi:hypothetical protein